MTLIARSLVSAAFFAMVVPAAASANETGSWTAVKEIVGQTSTATIAAGGNPLYVPPKPQYSGAVGILMNYGAAGSFVCSGSLVGANAIVTAAHCVSDGTNARPLSTTIFFPGTTGDPAVYGSPAGVDTRAVTNIYVNPLYTAREQAALAMTEAMTLISQGGVPDDFDTMGQQEIEALFAGRE